MKQEIIKTKAIDLRVFCADSFFLRLRGLLGRTLAPDEGLLLVPCGSIHTVGMGFAIDAVFLDKYGRVLHILRGAQPGHCFPAVRGAHAVLELRAGCARKYQIEEGDLLAANR